MIVKVLEVSSNIKEIYCQILSGNPDNTVYPSRLCIDPYICNPDVEPVEALVGRTFDIGEAWTVYTILPRQFQELANQPRFEKTSCSQCGQEFGPGDHGYSHCEDHQTIDSSPKALATELEPQEILGQASGELTKDCCSISVGETERKRQELAAEFEADPDSYVVASRLMSWIEEELEKRGLT